MSRSPSTWFAAIGALLLVVACACSQPAPRGPDPVGNGSGSTGGPGDDDDDVVADPGDDDDDDGEPMPAQGESCRASDDACPEGTRCLRYYGIAGPSGPEFNSCEIPCEDGCPDGQQCITIADGPGEVCRAP